MSRILALLARVAVERTEPKLWQGHIGLRVSLEGWKA